MIILYRIKGACDGCEMTIGITIISSIFVKLRYSSILCRSNRLPSRVIRLITGVSNSCGPLPVLLRDFSNKETTVLLHHSPIHLYDRHSFIDRYSWSLTRSWLAEGFGNCSYRPGPIATPSNSIQQPYNNHVHLWDRSEATIYGLLSYEGHLLRAKFWRHRDYQFQLSPFPFRFFN